MPVLGRHRSQQVCRNARTQFFLSDFHGAKCVHRLQARMATKKAKPNGHFHLTSECVEEYFRAIPIGDLPGVGYSTTQKLDNLQVKTCAELQHMTIGQLQEHFGRKLGETLHQHCRGIDNKPLTYHQVRRLRFIRPAILRSSSSTINLLCFTGAKIGFGRSELRHPLHRGA